MKKFFSTLFIASILLTACSSDDGGDAPSTSDDDGPAPVQATYRVTFTPTFTEEAFPTDYPANPTFSPIIAVVHASNRTVFNKGQAASAGLKEFAETGDGGALVTELSSQGTEDEQFFLVTQASSAGGATESQSVNVTVTPEKTRISVITSLNPSPDWFLGVNGFDIVLDANSLVSEETFSLNVLDAGTDSGTTYTSPDNPTSPAGTITVVNTPPITDASGLGASIGTITITRTDL